jgi:hypothetical protein
MSNHMMTKTNINSRDYTAIKIGAFKSSRIAMKLAKYLAKGVANDAENMAMAILSGVDEDDMMSIMADLCENVSCKGKHIDFDTHFMEFQEDLLPVLVWLLKENIMGFFVQSALEALSNLMPRAEEAE